MLRTKDLIQPLGLTRQRPSITLMSVISVNRESKVDLEWVAERMEDEEMDTAATSSEMLHKGKQKTV